MCIAGVSEVSESMKCHAGHYCPLGTTIQVGLEVNARMSLGKISDTMSFCSYFQGCKKRKWQTQKTHKT